MQCAARIPGTLFAEIFSTEVRYTGVTLGYQLGAALAGQPARIVASGGEAGYKLLVEKKGRRQLLFLP